MNKNGGTQGSGASKALTRFVKLLLILLALSQSSTTKPQAAAKPAQPATALAAARKTLKAAPTGPEAAAARKTLKAYKAGPEAAAARKTLKAYKAAKKNRPIKTKSKPLKKRRLLRRLLKIRWINDVYLRYRGMARWHPRIWAAWQIAQFLLITFCLAALVTWSAKNSFTWSLADANTLGAASVAIGGILGMVGEYRKIPSATVWSWSFVSLGGWIIAMVSYPPFISLLPLLPGATGFNAV